jgi:hypothetical protein
MGAEQDRLDQTRVAAKHWLRWGPYLSERQWGTVREDYSAVGAAWSYFPHAEAPLRTYRWGEDGIAGISDNHQRLCFALAMWNGRDSILKERLFGLTWSEGNHGESVKEYYHYLDNTPTHSYMRHLYRYPHAAFPYEQLLSENRRRSRKEPEFELLDTGVFDAGKYFDVFTEYAKQDAEDLFIRIRVVNRSDLAQQLVLLPTLWFRNTWSWKANSEKPCLRLDSDAAGNPAVLVEHQTLGRYLLSFSPAERILFTENESNVSRLFGQVQDNTYTKDAFHRYVIEKNPAAVNPSEAGTKAAPLYDLLLAPHSETAVHLRLCALPLSSSSSLQESTAVFDKRRSEADEFYASVISREISPELQEVQRQAFAGMLWTKQYYHYVVQDWLDGDSTAPPPPAGRRTGRNCQWGHLYNDDVLSMPDKWEYPWFASWDSAFHVIPLAMVDPDFAKRQLILLTREWYMHPNGQIPAYEWDFNDVTPPVHAWAAYRIYKMERRKTGIGDRRFLERVFQKLLLNFTWWINRKDPNGQNVFQGGFLGLDNIGVFDRSKELPTGGHIKQSDSTSWMAMYCLNMLVIAIELAKENPVYEDIASKFFEHFLFIAYAMNHRSGDVPGLWDEEDGFYYDILHLPDRQVGFLKVRSLVGLIPLFATLTLEPEIVDFMPGFKRRMQWFIKNRPDLKADVAQMDAPGAGQRLLLSLVNEDRLKKILKRMLDPEEFLSPYGIRSVSKFHQEHPYILKANGEEYRVDYEPAESTSPIYGGNSNWRGPIWWPINFLIIEALQRFSHYYEDNLKIECPAGSGTFLSLWDISVELSHRLLGLFCADEQGRRICDRDRERPQAPDFFGGNILFYEYFHGDSGKGLGASHQTGWTGLVAKLIEQSGMTMPGRE